MIKEEQQTALHKRKKGRKPYSIQGRLTIEGFLRKISEYKARLEKQREWTTGFGKYENLKDAETALDNINKKKKNTTSYYNPYLDKEYKIIDERNNQT